MSPSIGIVVVIIVAVLGIGYLVGRMLTLRAGMLRSAAAAADIDTSGLDAVQQLHRVLKRRDALVQLLYTGGPEVILARQP